MKIQSFQTIHGPNVYHHNPVLVATLNLLHYSEIPSHRISGFIDSLITLLPGLHSHTCSIGTQGGFYTRLQEGTYPGHIIEHIAIELSILANIPVHFGKTRSTGKPGEYRLITCFRNEEGMKACISEAVEIARQLFQRKNINLAPVLGRIQEIICSTKLGPTTEALFNAAVQRGIPCKRIGENSLLQLGYGKYIRRLQAAVSSSTSLIGADLVQDKHLTKQILSQNGIPVPNGSVALSASDIPTCIAGLSPPYAVKPLDGHQGQGINLNLRTMGEVLRAFEHAKRFSSTVLIEEMCPGKDFRVLVVDKKFVAAAERQAAFVIGDGTSSIATLMELLNKDPKRNEGHQGFLTKIVPDDIMIEHLRKQGFTLQSAPRIGQQVSLRQNANISCGGTSRDVTDLAHPSIRRICERAASLVDLDICGIDLIHTDISLPVNESFKIIEVNAAPGLRMHINPTEGKSQDVAAPIIEMLYPPGMPSRIPIITVTGTNGKTTVARLLATIFSSDKKTRVGLTSTEGIWISGEKILSGDTTGPSSAAIVLNDPSVDLAVLEVARGGIVKKGLGYDWADVAVITNIRPDHIGQDGIESIEDLVWIKSLVAERVKENAWLVLNADDEESFGLQTNPRVARLHRKILLYSTRAENPRIIEHVGSGGDAIWCDSGEIYLKQKNKIHRLARVTDIPITLNGSAEFQLSNSLASIGAAAAMGAPYSQIINGITSFRSAAGNNGRVNLFKIRDSVVILDYGHNPDAFCAIGEMLRQWQVFRKTAVLGLPGDRADHLLKAAASCAANYFDNIILRDDLDLRGRKPGEVPELMEKTIAAQNPHMQREIILNQQSAVKRCLDLAQPGEVIVIFYDNYSTITSLLRESGSAPIERLPQYFLKLDKTQVITSKENAVRNANA